MTAITTMTQAAGWHKDVFGKIIEARPDNVRLLDNLPFESNVKLGQQLSEVVHLTHENGFTYSTSASQGFALNAAVSAETAELNLEGGEIVLRSQTAYKPFAAAVSAGKEAFGNFYKMKVANMRASHQKRLEINAFHGGRSLSLLASISGTSTTRACVVSDATWAPWIWTGAENASIDAYITTTKQNTNADIVIESVDFANKTLNISGHATDMTALETGTTTQEFYWKGSYSNEKTGIIGAASNTGTLYGIDSTDYGLFAGNTIAVGSTNLTWDKVQNGIEEACGKGLDEDVCLYVPLPVWSSLNSDVAALRAIDAGYSKVTTDVGTSAISYHSMNGKVEVIASGCMKGGEALLFPKKEASRVGSTDATFEIPGMEKGQIFRYLDGYAAVEMQCYSDSAPLLRTPAKACLYSGIVTS